MFRVSDAIRSTRNQDGGIVLDVHHGQMFCLNVVGSKILEFLEMGYDESRIAEEIRREFEVSREVASADVVEFVEALRQHHILQDT